MEAACGAMRKGEGLLRRWRPAMAVQGNPPVVIMVIPLFMAGTLWLFNIAMGNGPFIDGLPGFTY